MERNQPAKTREPRATKEVSVMAWVENQFGDVLLLRQTRGKRLWTLPGGKVRAREALADALKREVFEETGLRIQFFVMTSVFERPEKGAITFLYTARIRGRSDSISPNPKEVETVRFSRALPGNATPSLRYFWKRFHESVPAGGPRPNGL